MSSKAIEQRFVPILTTAFIVILAFMPDYDAFVGDIAKTQSLLTLITGVPQELVLKHADKIIFALSVIVGGCALIHSLRYKLLRWVGMISIAICAYGVSRLLFTGINLKEALSPRNAAFLNIFLIACATAAAGKYLSIRRGLITGVIVSAATKLVYSFYIYMKVGGVEIFKGVAMFAADGGILALWGVAALWCFASALNNLEMRRRLISILWIGLMIVFVVAIGASFRRNIMFRLVGTLGLTTILGGFLYRRTFKALIVASVAACFGGALLVATLFAVFGAETAVDRIGSVSHSSDSNFSSSNLSYEDDWRALPATIVKHHGLGVGPGQSYGITRVVEELVDENGTIPLHTGSYELMASFGIIGLTYQLLVLIFIPIYAIRRGRAAMSRPDMLLAASVASLLWLGLWPFGPPFYVNTAATVLVGMQLGIVCGELDLEGTSADNNYAAA